MQTDFQLSVSLLRELLSYSPNTGNLRWKAALSPKSRVKVGDVAGCLDTKGYRIIRINRRGYKAHRIAWAMQTGRWPTSEIDHRNGRKGDNRWSNLRDASRLINAQNKRSAAVTNKSGFLGVSKHGTKWQAQIKTGRKSHYLGRFNSPLAAHLAYVEAKRVLHPGSTL